MISRRMSPQEKIVQAIFMLIFIAFCTTTLYPFLNVLAKSFTPGGVIATKPVGLLPIEPTLENYGAIMSDPMLLQALWISILRTVIGTALSVVVLASSAYAMSKRRLRGRQFIIIFLLIPMYLGAGMIPSYVNIVNLKLINNFWVYILPGLFSGFNFLLIMSYITTLPASYEESAFIDGASYFRIFAAVIVPLCKPILAAVTLFGAVGQWNSWFDATLYVNKSSLLPLQFVMQNIIKQNSYEVLAQKAKEGNTALVTPNFTAESISMATMVFSIVPILMVYPFLQKYFVQGITLGGLKE